MPTKPRASCQQDKDLGAFNRQSSSSDGRQSYCRECGNAKRRVRYYANHAHELTRSLMDCPSCGGDMRRGSRLCMTCFHDEKAEVPFDPSSLVSSPEDIAWLAGLLEGEGYFRKAPLKKIAIKMTDRDVVLRAAALLGHPGRAKRREGREAHHNPIYSTCTGRHEAVEHVVRAVHPWLGQRRQNQVRHIHSGSSSYVLPVRRVAGSDLNAVQVQWAAGLLEGEGSFLAPRPSSPNSPVLKVEMTDRDIIERFSAMWGVSTQAIKARERHYKTPYRAVLRGSRAVEWMQVLRPHMGLRRQSQIENAIDGWAPKPHGSQKLSDDQVLQIRQRKAAGEPARALAEEYGVTRTYVHDLVRGRYR